MNLPATRYAVERLFADEKARSLALGYAVDVATHLSQDALDNVALRGSQYLRQQGVDDVALFDKMRQVGDALAAELRDVPRRA